MKFDGDPTMSTGVILIFCVLVNVAPFDARTAHSFNILRLSKFTWIWSVFQEQLIEMEIMQKMSHFLFPEGTLPSFNDYFHINMFRDSWHTWKVWSWSKNRCLRSNRFLFSLQTHKSPAIPRHAVITEYDENSPFEQFLIIKDSSWDLPN